MSVDNIMLGYIKYVDVVQHIPTFGGSVTPRASGRADAMQRKSNSTGIEKMLRIKQMKIREGTG